MTKVSPPPKAAEEEVLSHLEQRGFRIHRRSPIHKTLLATLSPDQYSSFYRLLGHYGFRIFLRDVIRDRRRIRLASLTRYLSRSQVRQHMDLLLDMGIVRRRRAGLELAAGEVDSFGDTLEWYVAQILRREFAIPSIWGITPAGTAHGGDFDVLAVAAGRLAYLEVKSSPPKHVEESEVAAFLDRIEDVGPDVALFIEDTALRMKDKIVPLFEAALSKRPAWAAVAACRPRRLKDELFQVAGRIFIINGDPDLARNIGFCLRSFFRFGWSARLRMERRPGKTPPRKAGEAG